MQSPPTVVGACVVTHVQFNYIDMTFAINMQLTVCVAVNLALSSTFI